MDFQTTIDISAPAEVVWSVIADVERWPEWTPSVTSIRRMSQAPLAVGQRALVRQPRLPPAVWTVTTIDPGRSFTWKSGAPSMRVLAHHGVEPAGTGSRATLSLTFAGLLGGLLAKMTAGINRRYLALEANGLKRRSETLVAAPESR